MKEYYQYIEDVRSGKIVASQYIKQQVERLERFKQRDDMYFDEKAVQQCFDFFASMKHNLGKSAGQPFILLPWQKWVVGSIVGIKWRSTKLRVCRQTYLQMARKQGKSSLIAGLALYFMICDGEASAEIDVLATSRDQARILFTMCQDYAKTLDPEQRAMKHFRNYIKMPETNSTIKLFSSDASKLDGLSAHVAVIDEWCAQKDNSLYSVMKSSQAVRTQPMMILISTPQFNLEGPGYKTFQTAVEILSEVKEDDSVFDFLYTLDPEDEWTNEKVWIKSNPSLGHTVMPQYIRDQVRMAENDTSQIVPVKTKTIGVWCQSSEVWLPAEKVAAVMQDIKLEDYYGEVVYLGLDLSAVQDLTALSLMIPYDGGKHMVFFNWAWIPHETYLNSPNRKLYEEFVSNGDCLYQTPGNVVDYDEIIKKMVELREHFGIAAVYYDKWNSTQAAITLTELGFNMVPFSQAIGNYNNATKTMARTVLEGSCVIQKSRLILWQFLNATIKRDWNQNEKVVKESVNKKVDNILSMCNCVGGYLAGNVSADMEIFVL